LFFPCIEKANACVCISFYVPDIASNERNSKYLRSGDYLEWIRNKLRKACQTILKVCLSSRINLSCADNVLAAHILCRHTCTSCIRFIYIRGNIKYYSQNLLCDVTDDDTVRIDVSDITRKCMTLKHSFHISFPNQSVILRMYVCEYIRLKLSRLNLSNDSIAAI